MPSPSDSGDNGDFLPSPAPEAAGSPGPAGKGAAGGHAMVPLAASTQFPKPRFYTGTLMWDELRRNIRPAEEEYERADAAAREEYERAILAAVGSRSRDLALNRRPGDLALSKFLRARYETARIFEAALEQAIKKSMIEQEP
jgi:hypothetical protein